MEERSRFEEYMRQYGITLDEEQARACRQIEGKVLLLAVPGSGKTTTMIARLGYMTRVCGIPAASILAVTYSVAGAKEMQTRYERLFGVRDVEIRTIHGFCASLIRRYEVMKGRHAFALLDKEGDVTDIVRGILIGQGRYPSEHELRDIKTAITYCRNGMLTDEEIEARIKIEGWDFLPIYRAYREYKREHRLMDYDDQLVYGYRILLTCPEVTVAYADRFHYLCVDEAQDTSKIQHKILEVMTKRWGNLFMVGDEDQSIYGFRAAYPEALLTFDKTYPDATVLSLGRNYRSSATIVRAAARFIAQNTERRGADKAMTTDNPTGEPIRRTELADLRLLPELLARRAVAAKGRTAVLFRLNDSMLPVIDVLSEKGIPYRARGIDGLFFSHYIVSDVLAILRFAADPFDAELFGQLYYKFSCGISRREYEAALQNNVGEEKLSYPEFLSQALFVPENKRRRLRKLCDNLFRINSSDTYEAIRTIFFDLGYGSYLSHRTADTTKRNVLLALAYRHRSRQAFEKCLQTLEGAVKRGATAEEGILLSTIHSAKGREFDSVLLADCKNGILPSVTETAAKPLDAEEKKTLEEERRLFYVGVTRAKTSLELITWQNEFGEPTAGWDFVTSLLGEPKKEKEAARKASSPPVVPDEATVEAMMARYYEGTALRHKFFGDGVILGRKGRYASVRFARFAIPRKLDLFTCLREGLIREE